MSATSLPESDVNDYQEAEDGNVGQTGHAMGLFQSVHRLAATLVGIVHTRVELLTTELQEEVHYASSLVLYALVALFTGLLGLLLGGLTIIFAYWDTHRVLASVLVTAAYFVLTLGAILVLMSKIKSHRRFLDATLNELAKDSETLKATVKR